MSSARQWELHEVVSLHSYEAYEALSDVSLLAVIKNFQIEKFLRDLPLVGSLYKRACK